MIGWKEVESDSRPEQFERLRGWLTVPDALTLFRRAGAKVRVIVPDSVRAEVIDYLSKARVERGGLIIGRVYRREGDHVLLLSASVPSTSFDSTGVSLRMNTEVWDNAKPYLEGGASVVGWFHSHPNLGAFFSGTDRATQKAFFNHAYSVGWVIDPVRKEEAWFSGPASNPVFEEFIFNRK